MIVKDEYNLDFQEANTSHSRFLYNLYNDPSINQMAVNKSGIVEMKSILKTIEYFKNSEDYMFIFSIDNMNIGLGMIYNVNIKDNSCSLGIALKEDKRLKGIGTLILKKLINFVDKTLYISRIEVEINDNNVVALGLAKGFQFHYIGKNANNTSNSYYIKNI